MARRAYGIYSAEDRKISSRLFRRALREGSWEAPQKTKCDACWQKEGQIEWHREDYSVLNPSGLITLCFRCHRVLHLRHRNQEAWDKYRHAVRFGFRWPATKSFQAVLAENIEGWIRPKYRCNALRHRTVLDDVEDGLYLPDSPEVRRGRMDALWEQYGEPKQTLF